MTLWQTKLVSLESTFYIAERPSSEKTKKLPVLWCHERIHSREFLMKHSTVVAALEAEGFLLYFTLVKHCSLMTDFCKWSVNHILYDFLIIFYMYFKIADELIFKITQKHREINNVTASSSQNFTPLGTGLTTFIFPMDLSLKMLVTFFFPSRAIRSS